MRSPMMRAALVLVAGLLCRAAVAGCTLSLPPVKAFDATEYVFTGRVMNLAGPHAGGPGGRDAWGLLVEVEEAIHLPEAARTYEVYPYHLGADCSDIPWESEDVLKAYPFGTRVRVAAHRAKSASGRAEGGGVVRLEVLHVYGVLAHNTAEGGEVTASSVYDYKKFRPYPQTQPAPAERLAEAHYTRPTFELRKDLLRLKRAASEAERVEILERLVDYPDGEVDFKSVAESHVKNPAARKALLRKREARLDAQQ
jgi:hypothetical protein